MNTIRKIFTTIILISMMLGVVGPTATFSVGENAKVQPIIYELAADSPDELLRVLVYKSGEGDQAERYVEKLEGEVLKELALINAFAAVIPASAVDRLASLDAVSQIGLDAQVVSTGKPVKPGDETPALTPNTYLETLDVLEVWDMGYDGSGIGVAIIDSGISPSQDLNINKSASFNPNSTTVQDVYGHGTHVAGIVAGDGSLSGGFYMGVAPGAHLLNMKIGDETGMAYESDTVNAMEWILNNKDAYNIRVVNLSIQSSLEQSYHDSPLTAATEILWFNGIVVVAATGNWYGGEVYPIKVAPGNDPFVITVGATDEKGTTKIRDDFIPTFSAWGLTLDGFMKPEIFAPGVDIISVLSFSSDWDQLYPERTVLDGKYFRISGTSMATPMVAGAVALLLQAEPNLTPDQVKYRVMNAHEWVGPARYLNVYKMLTTPTIESANQGIIPHMLLAKMAMIAYWSSQNGEETIDWSTVDWDAVNWDAVDWDAVNWNAVNWNAVNWNAVNWNAVNWNAVNWNAVNWNAVNWNAVNWNAVNWNAVNWNAVNWNAGVTFASVTWNEE